MRTILITGFDRFPGSPINPSSLVATRLVGRRRPAFVGTRRIAHVFATRYDAVDRELPALLARERPDIVVMFGVDTRYRPEARIIAPHRDAMRNPLPIARLVKAARTAGVAAARSRNAGAYLCNYVYWRALEATARPDGPGFVIFIHLPPISSTKLPKKSAKKLPKKRRTRKRRTPRLNDLVRAGEAIVLAMISLAAGRR